MYVYILYIGDHGDKEIFGLYDKEHINEAYLNTKRTNKFYDFSWYELKIRRFQLNETTDVGTQL